MLNSWSYRKKLIFLWFSVQLLVTGLTSFFVANTAMESIEKDIRYQAEQIQPVLNSALIAPLLQRDYASVIAILKELAKSDNIESIRIQDANGRLVAQESTIPIVNGERFVTPFSVEMLIQSDGINLGKANVDISMVRLVEARNQILINTGLVSVLSLIFFMAIAIFTSQYITKPITDLVEITKNITQGDFKAPLFAPRSDEIGSLQNAFQSMSSEIAKKIEDLRFLNANLEKIIEDRTDSLQYARDELLKKVEELKLLGTVVDNSLFAISIADLKNPLIPIIYVNTAFTKVTGYLASEAIGTTCRIFQNGIEDAVAMQEINAALESRTDCTVEFLDHRKNGDSFWNRLSLFHVRIDNTEPRYFVIFQNDISTLKKSNMEREVLLQEAQDNQRLKSLGILVAGLAHEINNPLGIALTATTHVSQTASSMRKNLENLKESELADFLEDEEIAFRLIFDNLKRTSELVRGFQDIATDRSLDEKREVHLLTYIKSIEQSLTPLIKKVRCQLTLDIDPAIRVQTNTGSLGQLITNLILNATIHGFDGVKDGKIEIVGRQDANTITLKVIDNGTGIPASVLPNLFTPFFTTNRSKGGTGLGLYVSRQIATDVLNGSLQAENRPDRGCEFILQIPRTSSSASVQQKSA